MLLQDLKQEILMQLKEREFNDIDSKKLLENIDLELNSKEFLRATAEFYIFLKTQILKMEILKEILKNRVYN